MFPNKYKSKSGSKQLLNILDDLENNHLFKNNQIKGNFFKNSIEFKNISFFMEIRKLLMKFV